MTAHATPKLTDDAVSMLPLQAGRAELLEEIMSTVSPDRHSHPRRRRPAPARSRWLVPIAAAAAVAGIVAGSLWASRRSCPTGTPRWPRSPGRRPGSRAVLDVPGLGGHQHRERGRRLRRGQLRERPGQLHDHLVPGRLLRVVRRRPRAHRRPARPGRAGRPCSGAPARCGPTRNNDHTVIREVQDGFWIEFRGSGMDETAYHGLLGQLTHGGPARATRPRCPRSSSPPTSGPRPCASMLDGDHCGDRRRGPERDPGAGALRPDGPLPARSRGGRCLRLRLARGLRQRGDPRPAGTGGRGARVLGTSRDWPVLHEMDEDRRVPRGGLADTPTRPATASSRRATARVSAARTDPLSCGCHLAPPDTVGA